MAKRLDQKKLNKEQVNKAKELYMNYIPASQIAEVIGVTRQSIQYYVTKSWKEERQMQKADLMQHISEAKSVDFMSIVNSSTEILKNTLVRLAHLQKTNPEAVTSKDAKIVSEILTNIDKIVRLDENKPTEIITEKEKPLPIEELRQKLALDPFGAPTIQLKDEDYEETKEDE